MRTQLTRELRSLLVQLAKRNDPDHVIWFDCSLSPNKGDTWRCHVCQQDFVFVDSFLEIDQHGFQHLKDSNLLPFV